MKKMLITGVVLVIVGTFLFGLGYSNGGSKNIYWQNGGFRIDNSKYVTESFPNVDSIKLQSYDPIIIKKGNVRQVRVHYISSIKIHKDSANKVLKINNNVNERNSIGFELHPVLNTRRNLVQVTVPNKLSLKSVSGNSSDSISIDHLNVNQISLNGDAEVNLNQVNVKHKLSLDSSGDVALSRVTAPNVEATMSDGDIYVEHSSFTANKSLIIANDSDIDIKDSVFSELRAVSGDGDITINDSKFNRKMTASSQDGDILIAGVNPKLINIKAKTLDGDLAIFGRKNSRQSAKHSKVTYKLNSNDGDITVKK